MLALQVRSKSLFYIVLSVTAIYKLVNVLLHNMQLWMCAQWVCSHSSHDVKECMSICGRLTAEFSCGVETGMEENSLKTNQRKIINMMNQGKSFKKYISGSAVAVTRVWIFHWRKQKHVSTEGSFSTAASVREWSSQQLQHNLQVSKAYQIPIHDCPFSIECSCFSWSSLHQAVLSGYSNKPWRRNLVISMKDVVIYPKQALGFNILENKW